MPIWFRMFLVVDAGAAIALLFMFPTAAETVLLGALIAAVAGGLTLRVLRARRGKRVRAAFEPIMGAASAYQNLLLGKSEAMPGPAEEPNATTTSNGTSSR